MKPIFRVALVALSLSFAGTGCSKALCEEALDKAQDCVDNMKCNITDPLQRDQCEKSKNFIRQQNETLFKLACDEAEAQKYVDCALDPTTCTCPF
jgi:hypothetical protein